MLLVIIGILILWTIVGAVFIVNTMSDTRIDNGTLDFLNPVWIWNNFQVNIFGCIMLTLLFNLLIPLVSLCYWFYKLCTIGRRK